MKNLTVLYDINCELCTSIRTWLEKQPKYIEMLFVPAASEFARRRFPDLNHRATLQDLTVVSDKGDVYYGAKGWLMCLWALREYRHWSLKLSAPEYLPTVRRFVSMISRNRHRFRRSSLF
ncbi:MAG TPA: DCC1-like thiol-disulfide oxidoreductase family protein [Acidobacteriota bacterium]|nr:DCC1-like thiol-disulfide oxidoreductase family protein [Acidobacteriota bacterium]